MPSLSKNLRPLGEHGRALAAVAVALVATLLLLAWSPAEAYDSDAAKPESPCFHVVSSEPVTDRLPLKSTSVDMRIAGVIADVTVTQRACIEYDTVRCTAIPSKRRSCGSNI